MTCLGPQRCSGNIKAPLEMRQTEIPCREKKQKKRRKTGGREAVTSPVLAGMLHLFLFCLVDCNNGMFSNALDLFPSGEEPTENVWGGGCQRKPWMVIGQTLSPSHSK